MESTSTISDHSGSSNEQRGAALMRFQPVASGCCAQRATHPKLARSARGGNEPLAFVLPAEQALLVARGAELRENEPLVKDLDTLARKCEYCECMENTRELCELGERLVEDSKQEEAFSARGLMHNLFPYIYAAAKRMSARAISRWLKANGIKISDVTIAKGLRRPDKFAEEYASEYEPAARIVADAHQVDLVQVLADAKLFWMLEDSTPNFSGSTVEEFERERGELENAKERLKGGWFSMPEDFRSLCVSFVAAGDEEEREGNGEAY